MKFYLRVRKYFTRKYFDHKCFLHLLPAARVLPLTQVFLQVHSKANTLSSLWFDLSASLLLPLCNFAEATIPPYSGHTVSVQSKKSNLPGAKYVHLA